MIGLLLLLLSSVEVAKWVGLVALFGEAPGPPGRLHKPVDEVELEVGVPLLDNLLDLEGVVLELVTLEHQEPVEHQLRLLGGIFPLEVVE